MWSVLGIEEQQLLRVDGEISHLASDGEEQQVLGLRMESQDVFAVGKEEEQHALEHNSGEPVVASIATFCVLSWLVRGQHTLELGVTLEHDPRGQPVADFGATFGVLSRLLEEQHALELQATLEYDSREELVVASSATFGVISRLVEEQHMSAPVVLWNFSVGGSVGCIAQQEGSLILSISLQRHSARSRAAFHRARESCISPSRADRAVSPESAADCEIEACAIASRHFSISYQKRV